MRPVWKASVTVAAIVERGGRFLLVEEATADGVRLNQPAGHLERGESLVDAVAREALEETAHPFTPMALLGVYMARSRNRDDQVTYVRFAFTGELGERAVDRALDSGNMRTLWLTTDEIRMRRAEHRSPLVMQCVDDYAVRTRIPLSLLDTDVNTG